MPRIALTATNTTVRHSRPRDRRGFTLVEVIVVMVVLAILAGVALPTCWDRVQGVRISAARYSQGSLSTAIVQTRRVDDVATGGNGQWPEDLDDLLFTHEGNAMLNPFHEAGQPVYHVFRGNNRWHPSQKTIEWAVGRNRGAIWYNPLNGSVKFRVPDQGSTAATLELYNRVNGSTANRISQTDLSNR